MAKYVFCEAPTAASLAPWHIRPLTAAGKRLGGGIDTPSLCGRVGPIWAGGWDLEAEVEGYPLYATTDGRRHVCKTCADVYMNNTKGGDR